MTVPPSADVETLSCAIAGGYAGRWARALARLAEREAEEADEQPGPWFVDGFAGADLQRAALRGASVEPGAVSAVRAMADAGGRIRVVLVDEDPGLLARLTGELDRIGVGERVRRTADPASAQPGEIVLVESSFAALAPALAEAIGDAPALLRLAPPSARTLPWTALQPFAALAAAGLLLRFPTEDFQKQARITGPIADFPPHIRRVVEGCSALLSDPRHGWLAGWREAARKDGAEAALDFVLDRHRALIADAAEGRIVRVQRIDRGAESVHLLLATTDPAQALELNGAIADGGGELAPAVAAPEPEPEPDEPPPAVLDLFPVPPPPAEPKPRGPDPRAVADDLHARNRGALVLYPTLLASLADSGLTPEQVREALAILKRAGRAAYRSLDAPGAEIDFLLEPAPPAPPRKRKARTPTPGELGLFDAPED